MKNGKRVLLAGLLGLAIGGQASALTVYGVTTANSLVRFDSATPGTINNSVLVTGLNTGATLRGIDFRPVDGLLYGVSSDSRLYTINLSTGLASVIGAPGAFTLNGTSFGFDFNPTVDRIRVVSDTDRNVRLTPAGGLAGTDTNLVYAPADVNAGQNPNIVGSAYTNSFPGATTTTLYGIDSGLDQLVIQNPPNAGTLNSVGSLGFNTSDLVGFDIFFFDNRAFASLTGTAAGASSSLFSINLASGAATSIGAIGSSLQIAGIAIQQVPEPATITLLAAALLGSVAVRARRRLK